MHYLHVAKTLCLFIVQCCGPVSADGNLTTISAEQLDVLLYYYVRNPIPASQLQGEISAKTGLDMPAVQVWFQNRRAKDRKIMEGYKETSPSAEVQDGGAVSPGGTCSSSGTDYYSEQQGTQHGRIQAQGRSKHVSRSCDHYSHY